MKPVDQKVEKGPEMIHTHPIISEVHNPDKASTLTNRHEWDHNQKAKQVGENSYSDSLVEEGEKYILAKRTQPVKDASLVVSKANATACLQGVCNNAQMKCNNTQMKCDNAVNQDKAVVSCLGTRNAALVTSKAPV